MYAVLSAQNWQYFFRPLRTVCGLLFRSRSRSPLPLAKLEPSLVRRSGAAHGSRRAPVGSATTCWRGLAPAGTLGLLHGCRRPSQRRAHLVDLYLEGGPLVTFL